MRPHSATTLLLVPSLSDASPSVGDVRPRSRSALRSDANIARRASADSRGVGATSSDRSSWIAAATVRGSAASARVAIDLGGLPEVTRQHLGRHRHRRGDQHARPRRARTTGRRSARPARRAPSPGRRGASPPGCRPARRTDALRSARRRDRCRRSRPRRGAPAPSARARSVAATSSRCSFDSAFGAASAAASADALGRRPLAEVDRAQVGRGVAQRRGLHGRLLGRQHRRQPLRRQPQQERELLLDRILRADHPVLEDAPVKLRDDVARVVLRDAPRPAAPPPRAAGPRTPDRRAGPRPRPGRPARR